MPDKITFRHQEPEVVRVPKLNKLASLAASAVTDGDKGDVVVANDGTSLTVESATPEGGTFNVTGNISVAGGSVFVRSTPTGNATIYLYNEAAALQGLLYWQRANDKIILRRYAADNTTTEGEFALAAAGATLSYGLTVSGGLTVNTASGLGYSAGAGGSVTQTGDKSQPVTLNRPCGRIVTMNTSIAANGSAFFTFNNSLIANTDCVLVQLVQGNNQIIVHVDTIAVGSCRIQLWNRGASADASAMNLNFVVIKGSAS